MTQLLKYIKIFYSDIQTKEATLKLRPTHKNIIQMDIFKNILDKTSNMYTDKARIYLFILDKFSSTCYCGNITKFDNEKNIFRKYCSIKCRNKDPYIRQKISNAWDDSKKALKNKLTKETCQLKYGCDNPMQSIDIKNKANKTLMEKYGACSSTYSHFKNIKNYNKEYILKHFLKDSILDINAMVDYYNISRSNINKRMQYFDIDYKTNVSSYEKEIKDFIESLGIVVKQSNRTLIAPLELDLIMPDKKVAIEFNGLYWHSFGTNNVNEKQSDLHYMKYRHLHKTDLCEKAGYTLLHIFENEWIEHKEKWKSVIMNTLGVSDRRIHARKCKVKLIQKEAIDFLNINHLQGNRKSNIKLGLYYDTELVSVMTFAASQYNKNFEYEIVRFCSLLYTQVPGAASKLLKYFERNYSPKSIISYANRRWSKGNLYRSLNMTFNTTSNVNFMYFKNSKLYSRLKFQKHKLKELLPIFDPELTAMQNMINNGYRVIFDCGNHSFVKHYF